MQCRNYLKGRVREPKKHWNAPKNSERPVWICSRENFFVGIVEIECITLLKETDRDMDLTQELVDSTVDRVYVYEDNAVEVVMKHQDIFDFTKDYVEKGGGLNE